ncbi:DUF4126 domain-containing protein [Desertifilum sp. FACHB-1129]|uniref:DUF4126 domain-containing protein n=1 Tax=Desertifilum tharense IPPAS B-1220 TaxID=1781255 RepID=A0A1E5QEA5_9CYAN|nr:MULTISPECIES: DUF4126 domain-containing protein [Desertifilum]MCD8490231.1 DUF4126 domain-containing protein [Desertifilum sp.]MDA0211529.1 DUF4126 domain-containing protein [Cyanobacteria bacterium FC1]MBD2315021.1 DUF4126 domain-containing protein [Desertifilum sp. FACHB-1129]MBD2324715.1 DUF4126 domain-containing protein [Desertifilum sp. FACHB-866]MBD2334729.1 DUF4126 domain-containing protein [Desertifilum sp. FACHB-868]
MIELLAALSASAAAGLRIALPLLLIGLLYGESLWSRVPVLSQVPPPVVLGVLVSWSLFELFASKKLLGQRVLQIVQLVFSPIVGAIMGMAIAQAAEVPGWLVGLLGFVGSLLALVLQLVQAGWFYRLRGLPLWAILLQDFLCIVLVLFAFDAPQEGGLIALLLLWLAIRSSKEWYQWYVQQGNPHRRGNPRRYKQEPD